MPTLPNPFPHKPAYQVTEAAQSVLMRDGSTVLLHRVYSHGFPQNTLRAARFAEAFVVFDVRDAAPSLADDLPRTHDRDVGGLIFYTLRGQFRNADELHARILKRAKAFGRLPTHQPEALAA